MKSRWTPSFRLAWILIAAAVAASSGSASAQDAALPDEYSKRIQQRSAVAAFGGDMFGDQVSLGNGSLEITQTDIDLPGNNALPVRMGRRYAADSVAATTSGGHFAGWDMDIPSVHGVFSVLAGWTTDGIGADNFKRCSLFAPPPLVYLMGGYFSADEYWHGSFLRLPGSGDQELLARGNPNAHVPSDGHAYPVVTKEGAAVRCVALASTSESGSQGEGFEVVTPDGVVYTFNHMVTRHARRIHKASPAPEFLRAHATGDDKHRQDKGGTTHLVPVDYVLPRKEVVLYPSKVTDRFGNTVTYSWSTTNPWQLQQISANDGRHLVLTYSGTTKIVTSVSDGTRTWYYNNASVTFPDGTTWSNPGTTYNTSPHPTAQYCDNVPGAGSNTYTVTSKHPSGVTATFTVSPVIMGRSWVWRECTSNDDFTNAREPYVFVTMAVTQKKLMGPGLPPAGLVWTYAYGPPNHCWDPPSMLYAGSTAVACNGTSPVTRTMTVTSPDGDVTRYTFGNRYKVDEGLLLKTEYGWNGSSALRTVTTTYADPLAAPYAAYNGLSVRSVGDYDITGMTRPQRQVTTTQQGRNFTWQVATGCSGMPYCFDAFARPTKVVKSSSP